MDDNAVKPLITNPPKSGQITLATDSFYHRTNTFRTSEKRTPLNSEQWTLMNELMKHFI